VRKNSDATSALLELSANAGSVANTFAVYTSGPSPTYSFRFRSRGNAGTAVDADTVTAFDAPSTAIITGSADIAGDVCLIRANGVLEDTDNTDQGSGNYSANPLYIFSRGGSSLRFPGILYTLIIRGAATPTGTIADFEKNLLRIRAGLGPF
jgi:hypothetical protein